MQGIKFPQVGPKTTVDVLIGVDQSDLLYFLKDVKGRHGEPIARLTALGWTCIGNPDGKAERIHANFTFFLSDSDQLSSLVHQYWDIEEPTSSKTYIVNPDEKLARDTVANSLTFVDGHYSVGMPWKSGKCLLPDNYSMALQRLQNTEKKLQKSPELGQAYMKVLQTCQEAGYIHKVPKEEKKPDQVWYLPHFPVLRPD